VLFWHLPVGTAENEKPVTIPVSQTRHSPNARKRSYCFGQLAQLKALLSKQFLISFYPISVGVVYMRNGKEVI
jgi:hypothetical protein